AATIDVSFLPVRKSRNSALAHLEERLGERLAHCAAALVYRPMLLAVGRVSFIDRKLAVNETSVIALLVPDSGLSAMIRWPEAVALDLTPDELAGRPEPDAMFTQVPPQLSAPSDFTMYKKDFGDYLYREMALPLFHIPELNLYGKPHEQQREFFNRAHLLAREQRDAEVAALRSKYRTRLDKLETRLHREERELSEDQAEFETRKREELLSAGETIIGLLGIMGRRRGTSGISRSVRKRRMTSRARENIMESQEEIQRLAAEIQDIKKEMEDEAAAITDQWVEALKTIEQHLVKPRHTDVQVIMTGIGWCPVWEFEIGEAARTRRERVDAW
ncbi:hypothetical protein JW905_18455, partial [bacterium]|nr:hypothetical protein [candidate division CSSED10-310 bacterium]